MRRVIESRWLVGRIVLGAFSTYGSLVYGQVSTDGSLGSQLQLIGPNYSVLEAYGQVRGGNLFHSFSEFNVGTGESLTFDSSVGIDNILARITGGNGSLIAGTLNANANLFLVNPAGMVFSEGAALNVAGDLNVTTADYIRFDDNSFFYADIGQTSQLSVAAPTAFGFLQNTNSEIQLNNVDWNLSGDRQLKLISGNIEIQQSDIDFQDGSFTIVAAKNNDSISIEIPFGEVTSSSNLTTIGDIHIANTDISTDGENSNVYIRGGQIIIESNTNVQSRQNTAESQISVDIAGNSILLSDNSSVGGNVKLYSTQLELNNNAQIRSTGTINIESESVAIFAGSRVSSDTIATGNVNNDAGDIVINADSVLIDSLDSNKVTGITSDTIALLPTDRTGNGGNITVNAENITLRNTSTISSNSLSEGNSGSIELNVESLALSDSALISSSSLNNLTNAGSAGTIVINANDIDLVNLARIRIATQGNGDGGSLTINSDQLTIGSRGSIQASSFGTDDSAGNVGSIEINTTFLEVLSGGAILANSEGGGDGSTISIDADSIILDRGTITSQAKSSGNAGGIDITGGDIQMDNISRITSDTLGTNLNSGLAGNAGNINIFADSLSLVNQSSITNSTNNSGSAGQLAINASLISLDASSSFSVSSTGASGDVGDFSLFANSLSIRDGSSILANNSGSGNPGTISIYTGDLELRDRGLISTFSSRFGLAGEVSISAEDAITLTGNSSISSESIVSGGGDISLNAATIIRLANSTISTSVPSGVENGGNISIDPIFVVLDDSQITARAFGGNGGNINIRTDFLFRSGLSTIDASSDLGINGDLTITSLNSEFDKELVPLNIDFIDANTWLSQPCAQRENGKVSRLVIKDREGQIASPADLQSSNLLFKNFRQDQTLDVEVTADLKIALQMLDCEKPAL